MMQEATMEDRFAQELASLPPDDARKKIGAMGTSDGNITVTDQTDAPTILRQIADLDRELANAMSSSSEEQYEAWHQHATELQESNPLVESTLQLGDNFVDKMTQVEVNRAMVVTGLSVAQGGTSALPSHPDLSSGQPFVYTETPDGFELRSTYQANGKSMTMQFKSR
jgi:hypothetical protein